MDEKLGMAKDLILSECGAALHGIDDAQGEELIHAILSARRVFFIGVGRVMLALKAMCKRFAHLGIDAHCVGEITEPAMSDQDLLIAASGSGESLFPKAIAQKAKSIGAKVAWIGSNEESAIARLSDLCLRIPVQTKLMREGELASKQPMTSLFEQCLLLYGDIMAYEIIRRNGLDIDKLWDFHANLE